MFVVLIRAHSYRKILGLSSEPRIQEKGKPMTSITNLDGDNAPPLKNKVTSFQVLIGGAAELYVHFLNARTSTGMDSLNFFQNYIAQ